MNHEANIEGQIICGFAKTITKYSYANKRVLLNTSLCTDVPYSSKKISPRIFFGGRGGGVAGGVCTQATKHNKTNA